MRARRGSASSAGRTAGSSTGARLPRRRARRRRRDRRDRDVARGLLRALRLRERVGKELLDAARLVDRAEIGVVLRASLDRRERVVRVGHAPEDGLHLELRLAQPLAEEAVGVEAPGGLEVGALDRLLVRARGGRRGARSDRWSPAGRRARRSGAGARARDRCSPRRRRRHRARSRPAEGARAAPGTPAGGAGRSARRGGDGGEERRGERARRAPRGARPDAAGTTTSFNDSSFRSEASTSSTPRSIAFARSPTDVAPSTRDRTKRSTAASGRARKRSGSRAPAVRGTRASGSTTCQFSLLDSPRGSDRASRPTPRGPPGSGPTAPPRFAP